MYLLTKHPYSLDQLQQEIRETFLTSSEISAVKCARMPYLNAVIEESLRLYPPVASSLPRLVPSGGDFIDGRFVSGNVSLSRTQCNTFELTIM